MTVQLRPQPTSRYASGPSHLRLTGAPPTHPYRPFTPSPFVPTNLRTPMHLSVKYDLAKQVRTIVDDELERSGGTFVSGLIAQKVVARLREEDPELLQKFLDQQAVAIFTRMVGDISRALKAHARQNSGKQLFGKALERQEAGEPRALAAWLDTTYVVTTNEQRKRLRDMDRQDLEYAIRDYTERSRSNALQANFLKALAKKVGARTVGEVYTDQELIRMWNSVQ